MVYAPCLQVARHSPHGLYFAGHQARMQTLSDAAHLPVSDELMRVPVRLGKSFHPSFGTGSACCSTLGRSSVVAFVQRLLPPRVMLPCGPLALPATLCGLTVLVFVWCVQVYAVVEVLLQGPLARPCRGSPVWTVSAGGILDEAHSRYYPIVSVGRPGGIRCLLRVLLDHRPIVIVFLHDLFFLLATVLPAFFRYVVARACYVGKVSLTCSGVIAVGLLSSCCRVMSGVRLFS